MNTWYCVFQSLRSLSLFLSLSHTLPNAHLLSHQQTRTLRRQTHEHRIWGVWVPWPPHGWPFPLNDHLNSQEISSSSWVFSDVCNYPVSRHCLVKDKEMHILLKLHAIEEKAWNRPHCALVTWWWIKLFWARHETSVKKESNKNTKWFNMYLL